METYETKGGVTVRRVVERIPVDGAIEPVLDALDSRRGVVFASSYEYPGRYTRWDMGFVDPPVELSASGRDYAVRALNDRGLVLLDAIGEVLEISREGSVLRGHVPESAERVPEEQRSRKPTMFTVIRRIVDLFASPDDPHLGLYGAFGYDLVFQFEPMPLRLPRPLPAAGPPRGPPSAGT